MVKSKSINLSFHLRQSSAFPPLGGHAKGRDLRAGLSLYLVGRPGRGSQLFHAVLRPNQSGQ